MISKLVALLRRIFKDSPPQMTAEEIDEYEKSGSVW
jgi:hypothetical protein